MTKRFDVVVVGAGIVGMATAWSLLQRRPALQLAVLEKEAAVAPHQSGRNSGVLHSGLYYRPGSRKALLCRSGSEMMVDFCRAEGIPWQRHGKVVIASDSEEVPKLDELEARGRANGLEVRRLSPAGIRELEPHAAGRDGLFVPEAGTVEYDQVTRRLAELIEARGGRLSTGAEVRAISERTDSVVVTHDGADVEARLLVNCAGLYSDKVAVMAGLHPEVRIVPFRGEYFRLRAPSADLVRNSIYPVPDPAMPFLGVHLTRRVTGAVEAGPNAVPALAREGYAKSDFDAREAWEALTYSGMWRLGRHYWRAGMSEIWRSANKKAFVRSVQRLVPEVTSSDLEPGDAGVRAQAVARDGSILDDFVFEMGERSMHVLNAPSPAATASLAIGDHLADRALSRL